MWHYARGVAFARQGDLDAARSEATQIADIARSADWSMLLDWAVPAPDLLSLARHVLEARIAQAEGNLDQAIEEFRLAVQIEDSLAYMEPPYWYYPVRQSLGAALLMAGRAEDAQAVFQKALINAPNNGWALFGLMNSQEALGDAAAAAASRKLFERAWAGNAPPELARL
jgi:tetratricopeptide (TPR) repeat protein